jgi:multicomponent Na+:H+ antiporter subunit C
MSPNTTYLVVVAALYAAGVYLLLDRSLTRVLLGILLLGNATNVLILSTGGPAGGPPIVGRSPVDQMSDPLPQAMILTAIVITLGVAAFVLSLIYRSWVLDREEEINDDEEDRRIAASHRDADWESSVEPHESPYDSGEDLDRAPTLPERLGGQS